MFVEIMNCRRKFLSAQARTAVRMSKRCCPFTVLLLPVQCAWKSTMKTPGVEGLDSCICSKLDQLEIDTQIKIQKCRHPPVHGLFVEMFNGPCIRY
jgi:hypothetical protein